jgi:CubicO group peptidase (beta-lactamase class C family)
MIRSLAIAVSLLITSSPSLRADSPLNDIDVRINQMLKDWDVPGLAIAIVKDDAVVHAKGYGVRTVGETKPVDGKTMFAIGSVTKSFTAAALAVLVDENKLKWDDPVTKHLPEFQLFDPYATRELTVRDLLCHRAGLERGDLLWYSGAEMSRDEIIRRLRFLKPSWSLRSKYGYQNICYLAAGQIIPRVAAKTWENFVAERFFKPLGMNDTVTTIQPLRYGENVASPHDMIDEKLTTVAWHNLDNISPAGSINSNVTDMAQWVRLQLGSESAAGRRLISQAALKELHTPQTILRREGVMEKLYPDAHFLTYGLGWHLFDYRGRLVVEHGGAIDGMIAMVALVPEEKLGLVILCNRDGTRITFPLLYSILDSYLGAPPRDRNAEFLKIKEGLDKLDKDRKEKDQKERVAGTKPTLDLDKFAGNYKDEFYGTVTVSKDGELLTAHYGQLHCDLEHWHFDTFRVVPKQRHVEPFFLTFHLGRDGKPASVKFDEQFGSATFNYQDEGPKAIALSEDELKKFVGEYVLDAPPLELSIELVGGKLKASLAGQPATTLVPVGPNRFKVEGAPGSFAGFELADGKVHKVTLETKSANLTFVPKKN